MNSERLRELQPAVDWDARQGGTVKKWLNRFESWSMPVERLVGRIAPDRNLNPLYHTGTITVFLLVLLLVTGIYLTLFYEFGFDATYGAVEGIEANPLSRIIRAIHRYASAATLITAVIHAWRAFFMDRFRGARWVPWVTGVASVSLVWLAGVTGYWLMWDVTAGPLNQSLIDLLGWVPGADAFIVGTMNPEFAGSGWVFLVLVITAHVVVSGLIGVLLWYHLRRLNRARWLPPAHWIWVTTGILVLAGIAAPVGMQPIFDPNERAATLDLDLWFLAYLPAALRSPAVLWSAVLIVIGLGAAIPWLLRRRLPAPPLVDAARCTGCTLCYVDCPYNAVTMERQENDELLAVVDSRRCVSCGICIGSCPPLAISFDGTPPEMGWPAERRTEREGAVVIYACERHLPGLSSEPDTVLVPVPCVGAIHPDETDAVLTSGARQVRLVGCPVDDCANREGNEWIQERLTGTRRPKAKEHLDLERVEFDWRAPGDSGGRSGQGTFREAIPAGQWRRLLPVAALLGLLLIGQILLTSVEVDPYGDGSAVLEISMKHTRGALLEGRPVPSSGGATADTRLEVLIDGSTVFDRSYAGDSVVVFEQIELEPGVHSIGVLVDGVGSQAVAVYEEARTFSEYEVVGVTIADAAGSPDPGRGEDLFTTAVIRGGAGCRVCHSLRAGDDGVGPSLAGVATRAAGRVGGIPAEEYLKQSILEPDSYIVDGYPEGQMRAEAGEDLTDAQLADLIAFLMTLR